MNTRAIVAGGSIAGLAAAAAIRPFYDEVVVVEQDVLEDGPALRRGVPQACFVHSLLERGRRELETLFPGLTDEMLAAGVPVLDFGSDVAALRASGWIRPAPLGLRTLWPSRPLLEATVRRLCRARYDIRFVTPATVAAIDVDRSRSTPRVTGARIRSSDGAVESLPADLFVDATGRGSRAKAWLDEHGIGAPDEERVDARCGYSARMYAAPDPASMPADRWWRGIVIECAPPDVLTGGVLLPIEGNRWLVTLMGFNGAFPPTDNDEFEAFARSLRSPILGEAIALARPIGDVAASRSFVNRFRRFDRWMNRLRGFVAIGDAACSFNPIYGQGMSTAAAAAALLGRTIAEGGRDASDLADRFHAAQGDLLTVPWNIATASDFLYPGTSGERPPSARLRSAYFNALFEAAWQDPELHRQCVNVFHLIAHPDSLVEPWVVGRAAWGTLLRLGRKLMSSKRDRTRPPRWNPGAEAPARLDRAALLISDTTRT